MGCGGPQWATAEGAGVWIGAPPLAWGWGLKVLRLLECSVTRPCSADYGGGYGDIYGGGRGVTNTGRKPIGHYMPTGVVNKGAPPDEKKVG